MKMNCDEQPDVMESPDISYVIPRLDDDVREGWKWWLKQEKGGNRCPSTRTDMCCEHEDCQRFCLSIFTKIKGGALPPGLTFEEWCNNSPDCPCLRYGSTPVRQIVAKVLAEQKPQFKPYAAVDVDTRHISVVVKDTLGCPSDTLIHIRNPEGICFVAKKLGFCDSNPALDAVLDELKRIINFSATVRGFNDTWISKSDIIDQIASLRKGSPAKSVDILDEAFIRKQEREKVIEEVRR